MIAQRLVSPEPYLNRESESIQTVDVNIPRSMNVSSRVKAESLY